MSRLLLIVLAAALLGSCGDSSLPTSGEDAGTAYARGGIPGPPPTGGGSGGGGAQTSTNVERFPVEGRIDVACIGEEVSYSGTAHGTLKLTSSSGGTFTMQLTLSVKGKGEGVSSGNRYNIDESVSIQDKVTAGISSTFDYRLTLVGQGNQVPNLRARMRLHFLMNAQGDVVLSTEAERFDCR